MEFEVGYYVRTPYHSIEKIKRISKENGWTCVTTNKDAYELKWLKNNKVKHSKNIIDLIEVGDIIEINNEKYEVIYDKSYCKLGVLIPNKEQLAIRHCSLEYIFSKQRNGRV